MDFSPIRFSYKQIIVLNLFILIGLLDVIVLFLVLCMLKRTTKTMDEQH